MIKLLIKQQPAIDISSDTVLGGIEELGGRWLILFETPRLVVRQLRHSDADALFAVYSDPLVVRWVGDGTPLTHELCVKWIKISLRNYQTKGFGASAVVAKSNSQFIGCCGIIYDPQRNEPEIIYGFGKRWWGQGFASEVVRPMLAYGLKQCGLKRILATIAPENLASVRVAIKAGMVFEREEIEADGSPTLIYSIDPNTIKNNDIKIIDASP
ncbi:MULTISPECIES: GNAT family N-acetyltransferase [Nostocales]|uniref:GNAT family N-acetyltransferase n=4 Tax=Nostocales TaxID=1161 RepID=A0A0C1NJL0_9CYAN|nr:GNAT family N-acetyltransferase [Tolypothrix bouteillei]KAF3888095.1 GNAT family N-acetyltransferase [Tolypothrix bouteillei VB521301]